MNRDRYTLGEGEGGSESPIVGAAMLVSIPQPYRKDIFTTAYTTWSSTTTKNKKIKQILQSSSV